MYMPTGILRANGYDSKQQDQRCVGHAPSTSQAANEMHRDTCSPWPFYALHQNTLFPT